MHNGICEHCLGSFQTLRRDRKYCSPKCGAAWRWSQTEKHTSKPRACRECGSSFYAKPDANQQWICSEECRKTRQARAVREFHKANPERESWYRKRMRERQGPDSNQRRFYRTNPDAPRACQSCGEHRVLEIAHRPGYERMGRGRSISNCKWPEMVWVLCPTCHRLLDRMNYSPEELKLT